MILTNKSLSHADILRNLGLRFREYRMQQRLTRKEVAELAAIGMTTIYKFETGLMTDISFRTLIRLLRAIGMYDSWEQLLPEIPESPYLYDEKDNKKQRVRHPRK